MILKIKKYHNFILFVAIYEIKPMRTYIQLQRSFYILLFFLL